MISQEKLSQINRNKTEITDRLAVINQLVIELANQDVDVCFVTYPPKTHMAKRTYPVLSAEFKLNV